MAEKDRASSRSDHRDEAREWLAEYGLRYWPDVTPRWSDDDMVAAFGAGERYERQRSGRVAP